MLGHALAGAGDAALKALAADYEAFATKEADVRDVDGPISIGRAYQVLHSCCELDPVVSSCRWFPRS